jgi:hypothetical protein
MLILQISVATGQNEGKPDVEFSSSAPLFDAKTMAICSAAGGLWCAWTGMLFGTDIGHARAKYKMITHQIPIDSEWMAKYELQGMGAGFGGGLVIGCLATLVALKKLDQYF